jgi:hypothetical protein
MTHCLARDISGIWNSSGSTLWALTKYIKPLIDANCHIEAVKLVYHQSSIRFPPIFYRNVESGQIYQRGQSILFGCPLELRVDGELKKVPPVLEYLLDSLPAFPDRKIVYGELVGQ